MVSPWCGAWRLTLGSYYEIPEIVKLCVPPQQSWGGLLFLLDEFDMVIVTTADRLYGQFGGEAWEKERAIINLVGGFINSLPTE